MNYCTHSGKTTYFLCKNSSPISARGLVLQTLRAGGGGGSRVEFLYMFRKPNLIFCVREYWPHLESWVHTISQMRSGTESQKSKRQQFLAFQMLKCRQLLPKLVCAFIIPKPLKTGFLVFMPTFATSESRANVWPVQCINLKALCGLCECPFLKVVLSLLLLFKLYAGFLC